MKKKKQPDIKSEKSLIPSDVCGEIDFKELEQHSSVYARRNSLKPTLGLRLKFLLVVCY